MLAQLDWLARNSSHERIRSSLHIHRGPGGFGILFDDACIVQVVESKSDASRSGLRVGDRVVCVNGCPCKGAEDFKRMAVACRSLVLSIAFFCPAVFLTYIICIITTDFFLFIR